MNRFARIRETYAEAVARAPALQRRLAAAGIAPADILDAEILNRIPVLKKEQLLAMQAAEPPFGGLLACEIDQLAHIYVSPGPIMEPSPAEDSSGHGMQRMFAAAGIGRGDLALNTWSYHLVPAGLLFDRGLRACGVTVIPAGTGNTELLAELMITLRPTVFLGSSANFGTIVEQIRRSGRRLPADWALRHAFLAGEFGDWASKRQGIEQEFGLKTWTCYATADFGLIGFETEGQAGYRIHPDRYVQICDPGTGLPVPVGESGEIVVTTLTPGWPLIRFGTGDLGRAESLADDGGVEQLAAVEGRVGAARKIREIFVYPDHLRQLATKVAGLAEVRLRVSRAKNRDVITLEILAQPDAEVDHDAVSAGFRNISRLRVDRIVEVSDVAGFGHSHPIAED